MTEIGAALVKQLREKTGAGIMDCKQALAETQGDVEKATDLLRKKGVVTAAKRAGRALNEGIIESYIHMGGKIGVMVEVNCETDFVAKTPEFKEFARNIAMHIAATNPLGIQPEDISEEIVAREKDIFRSQAIDSGKPENIVDKIAEGKLNKFFKENCLLNQAYVKDPNVSVNDYLTEVIGKTGENIIIRRFSRFQVGEE